MNKYSCIGRTAIKICLSYKHCTKRFQKPDSTENPPNAQCSFLSAFTPPVHEHQSAPQNKLLEKLNLLQVYFPSFKNKQRLGSVFKERLAVSSNHA